MRHSLMVTAPFRMLRLCIELPSRDRKGAVAGSPSDFQKARRICYTTEFQNAAPVRGLSELRPECR